MGLLQKLKSALGLDGTESSGRRTSNDVDVTIEREPSTEDEDAVKGTETTTTPESESDTEAVVTEESDDASEAESGDEPTESEPAGGAAAADAVEEPDEAESAEEPGEAESTEESDASAEPDEPDVTEATDGSDDPVTELNGIGPAYGERLSGVGIETVGELAAADAADIASQTDLGENRVADWIAKASDY